MSRPTAPTAPAAPTAIVAPLERELSALRRLVSRPRTSARRLPDLLNPLNRAPRGFRVLSGLLGDEPVALAATGDGPRAAERGLAALLAAVRPRRLLILGVAGGLSPEAAAGTVVASRRVLEWDAQTRTVPGGPRKMTVEVWEAPRPDPRWLERAQAAGASAGTMVTARRVLVGAAEKAELGRELAGRGLGPAPWVVDLESSVYARVAAAAGVPYLVLRAVLDGADEALPLDFNRCLTAAGGIGSGRVVARAMLRPSAIPSLWELRGRVRLCSRRLAAIARTLVVENPDRHGHVEELADAPELAGDGPGEAREGDRRAAAAGQTDLRRAVALAGGRRRG